jgi:cellulose synthase/poly-beta-1,6-N-acetylglucosamine synthase-like glycosyltransferase
MKLKYILITPAYNEGNNIERIILSMLKQTHLPIKWVIVSDGSTDSTNTIVEKYINLHHWIELVKLPVHQERNFSSKVNAFNVGYNIVKDQKYDIIGNLDADLSFEKDYMEYLIKQFSNVPLLGVAGTPFIEDNFKGYDYRFTNIEHVSGACQLFRRKCFEEIGGYVPRKIGGIDWVAVTTARMKGWKTRTFQEKFCYHHRKIGSASNSSIRSYLTYGKKDYYLGWHPMWELFRALYKIKKNPKSLEGFLTLIGYFGCYLKRKKIQIDRDLLIFNRKEQLKRLRKIIISSFS